jgi:hypothetical protein
MTGTLSKSPMSGTFISVFVVMVDYSFESFSGPQMNTDKHR